MNEIYKKNLKVIKKMSDVFAKKIEDSKENWCEVVKAENGKDNLLVKKNNRYNLAYPVKDPIKATRGLIKNYKFSKDTGTILIGMGLGHTAYHSLKKMDKGHKIIVVEPVYYLTKLAMQTYDFTKWLEDGSLYIASAPEDIAFLIGFLDTQFVIQNYSTVTEQYVLWCEEYVKIAPYTFEILNQHKCGVGTVMGAGNIIADNDIKNLPYIIRNRGIEEIRGLFKDKPAVLINTGPSLAKNIHLLRDIQDRVIIISVAQALRILLAYDIKPDFICTVDYGEVNYEHFIGLMDSKITMCCLNRTYAPILKEWQGAKFICCTPTPGFDDTTSILQAKGSLEQGGSVSHMNMGLAQHLGCDPIMIMGQDFAFNDGIEEDEELKSHIEQVDAGGVVEDKDGVLTWKIKDPRSSLKKSDHSMGGTTIVPGYFGFPVKTNIGLASFITSMERMVKDRDQLIIDATEGGCSIEGTKKMTLQKCIDEVIPKESIDKSVIESYLSLCDNYDELIKKSIRLMKTDIENLEKLEEFTQTALDSIKEVEKLRDEIKKTEDNDILKRKLKKELDKNEYYSKKAHDKARQNALVTVSIYHASRQIARKELKVSGCGLYNPKNFENLNLRIYRNRIIISAANETATRLLGCYRESLDIMQKYYDTKDESLLVTDINEPIDLTDAQKYFDAGNWAHVLVDCNRYIKQQGNIDNDEVNMLKIKALVMRDDAVYKAKDIQENSRFQDRIDFNELIDKAYKLGREEQKFEEAKELFDQAYKLFPDREDVNWGLATVNFKLGNIEDSIKGYEKLMEEYPDNFRYKFEYALVILETDFDKSMEILGALFTVTDYYDFYLPKFADLWYKANRTDKAITALEHYLKKFPGDYEMMRILERYYLETGDVKKANKIKVKHERIKK